MWSELLFNYLVMPVLLGIPGLIFFYFVVKWIRHK